MAKKDHKLLWLLGLGGAAFAGYKYVYEPWKMNQDLTAAGATGTGTTTGTGISYGTGAGGGGYSPSYSLSPSPLTYVSSPATITPSPQNYLNTGGPSNLSPGNAVGGLIGACMNKKGWTQSVCTTKLRAMLAAYQDAVSNLQQLQSGSVASALQAQLAANQAAAASDLQQITSAQNSGNAGGVIAYKQAYAAHSDNVKSIQSQIAAIPSRITAYTSAIAAYITQFQNATGADIRTVASV